MQLNSAIFDCIYLRDTEVLFLKPTITVSQEGISYESLFLMNVHGQSQIPSFATKYMQIFKHTTEKALNIVKNHNVSNHRFFYVCTSKWQSKSPVCDTSQRHIKYGCVFISVSIVFMHVYMLFTSYTYEQNIRI